MATSLPSDTTKANFDAGTDDPKQARVEFATNADIQNELKSALGDFAQLSNPSDSGLEIIAQGGGTPDDIKVNLDGTSIKRGTNGIAVDAPHERKVNDYTALAADRGDLIEMDKATALTLNLTAAATLTEGWFIYVNNSGTGTLTIDPNSAELIDDASTITLEQNQSAIIFCDGAAFWTVGLAIAAATKEFTVPIARKDGGTYAPYSQDVGDFPTSNNDSSQGVRFVFYIPNDFISLVDAVVMVLPDASETIQWDVSTDFGADGESRTANSDSVTNATKAVTIDTIVELDVSGALTGLAAGDWVGMDFQSDTSSLRPTLLRIRYN